MEFFNVSYDFSNGKIPGLNDGDASLIQSNARDDAGPSQVRPSSSLSISTDRSTPHSTSSSNNIPLIATNDGVNWDLKKEKVIADPDTCPLCKNKSGRGYEYFLHTLECLRRQSSNPWITNPEPTLYTELSESLMLARVGLKREETTSKRRYPLAHSTSRHPPIKRQRLQHGKHRPVYMPTYDTYYY